MTAPLRRHAVVLALMVVSAVLAVVVARHVFPYGSINQDELGYLSQAEALRHGDLTLPKATHDPNFLPFLSGEHGDRVVFKYQPAWPALLAAVHLATGSYLPALAGVAALTTLSVYLFAVELVRRRIALVATALFALSPFTVIQSGTYLAYLVSALFLLGFAALWLRAVRLQRAGLALAAGALLGLAAFHRTFDALLWAPPLAVYVAATVGRPILRRSQIGWVLVGALPFAVLYLAYNQAVMDGPLTPAFTASGSIDTFGFGRRASFEIPGVAGTIDYQPGLAWRTVRDFAGVLPKWTLGWAAGLVLAAVGVWATRSRSSTRLLVALALVVPAGYVFWWGTANAANYDLHQVLGPFYWFPVVVPLSVLTALGLELVLRRLATLPRLWLAVSAVALLIVTVLPLTRLVDNVRSAGRDRTRTAEAWTVRDGPPSLAITEPEFRGSPYVRETVPADLEGTAHLVALSDFSPAQLFSLVDRFPNRRLYAVRSVHDVDDFLGATFPHRRAFERLVGSQVPLDVAVAEDRLPAHARLYVELDGRPVRQQAVGGGERVALVPSTQRSPGRAVGIPKGVHEVTVGIGFGTRPGDPFTNRFELRWPVRVAASDSDVEVLTTPSEHRFYAFPNGRSVWAAEDVSGVIRPGA